MYCILTKSDSTWKLPITSIENSGSKLVKKLLERDDLYYQKNIIQLWTSEELFNQVGIVRFEQPSVPTGKKESGSLEDTLDGYIVTRKKTWADDPDYSEPTDADRLVNSKNQKNNEIKETAKIKILAVAPEWKQRNFSLLYKEVTDGTVKTAAEADGATDKQKAAYEKQKAEWDAQEAMWVKVNTIRDKSDSLETLVNNMTDRDDVIDFDVSLDSNWE